MPPKPKKARKSFPATMGRPTLYKPEYCQMLIDHMASGMSFYTFAAVIKCSPDTCNEWVHVHKDFSAAKIKGKALELEWWENLLRAGAAGKVPGYNAASVIFALKNKMPSMWRDKHEIVSTVNVTHEVIRPKDVIEILKEDKFLDYEDVK
jgi:hypothetical protein